MLFFCFNHFFWARAKKCTKFHWFFGGWENLVFCFRYLLTFSNFFPNETLTSCPFFSLTFGIGEHTKHCSMSFLYSSTRNMLQCFVKPKPNQKWVKKRGNLSEFHSERNYLLQNELWLIWLGGGKGYFRHSSKLFYIKGIAVGQPPISYHFWVCWWTSFPAKLRPLRLEVAEICWGCWKQPQAHKNFFHNKSLVF